MKYIVTESQYKLLIEYDSNEEGMSSKLRRRLAGLIQHAKDDLEWYVDDEMDPCQYSSVGDFVAEACDFLKDLYIDNIRDFKVSPKDNDALYYYFVDNYGGLLYKIYYKRCAGGDITESQENKLEKHLANYLDSLDYSKIEYDGTRIDVYLEGEEFPPIYDAWDEDHVDGDGNVQKVRFMSLTDEMYQKLLMLFGMTPNELEETIIKWFNNKFNDKVDRLSNLITLDD
jgi:hypothetical protein